MQLRPTDVVEDGPRDPGGKDWDQWSLEAQSAAPMLLDDIALSIIGQTYV